MHRPTDELYHNPKLGQSGIIYLFTCISLCWMLAPTWRCFRCVRWMGSNCSDFISLYDHIIKSSWVVSLMSHFSSRWGMLLLSCGVLWCCADDECSGKGLDSTESSCAKTIVCTLITNCLNRIAMRQPLGFIWLWKSESGVLINDVYLYVKRHCTANLLFRHWAAELQVADEFSWNAVEVWLETISRQFDFRSGAGIFFTLTL